MSELTQTKELFETARPMLTGLAYRILGSAAEAEDVVQDCFLAWMAADRNSIARPQSWLATVCTRKAIDSLRSARHSRTSYIGAWLPEPIQTQLLDTPESDAALSESVTTAFLIALERLAPKERAAFLLRDVFAMEYDQVAGSLEISAQTCRKLVSRARANIRRSKSNHVVPRARQDELVEAFQHAIVSGSTEQLAGLLASDAVLSADSGGKVVAIRRPLEGALKILEFFAKVLSPAWREGEISAWELNASRAIVLREEGRITAAISFAYDETYKVSDIFIMRNPDKLSRIDEP